MDSNASSYLLNHAALPSEYYLRKEDSNIIDLGLSLRVLQPESCYSSSHENYEVLVDWNQLQPQLNKTSSFNQSSYSKDDESEGIQSKERWKYVKVNMDGVVVGRKVCILDHMDYSTLAFQLEDMFGKQSMMIGLRLFQAESQFTLFYKDKHDQWRIVGDVPWKEFVDRVKRLRIAYKDEAHCAPSSSALLNSL